MLSREQSSGEENNGLCWFCLHWYHIIYKVQKSFCVQQVWKVLKEHSPEFSLPLILLKLLTGDSNIQQQARKSVTQVGFLIYGSLLTSLNLYFLSISQMRLGHLPLKDPPTLKCQVQEGFDLYTNFSFILLATSILYFQNLF